MDAPVDVILVVEALEEAGSIAAA
jgi:hypothetical protein